MDKQLPITTRDAPPQAETRLAEAGLHRVLARVYAARGVTDPDEFRHDLASLLAPREMHAIGAAAALLADTIDAQRAIAIVADYDCDGASACAVAMRGLASMGARVDYLVPNRFEHGYGLTPEIVELIAAHPRIGCPALIVTVDNGIASVEGVARARALGIDVLVTDHHLPGDTLPDATVIVNPNQPGCAFPSKNLAGVGVMFYVLLALRAELRRRGRFAKGPALQSLLDLVALGTVADLVRLDRNNRLLVAAGLRRIRAGQASPGLSALLAVAGSDPRRASCADLGFAAGPRINAAGRLADITLGIECLIADDAGRARALAQQLDEINRARREIESQMREQALEDVEESPPSGKSLVVFRPAWHEGVVGLVASRLKDRHHRPTVAFAPSAAEPGMLRGSGRSIAGIHLRDVLDLVAKREPATIARFGGHAMAAGLTLAHAALARFTLAFERAVGDLADAGCFDQQLLTDGPVPPEAIDLGLVEAIDLGVWGQGFPAPLFSDQVEVISQRLVKERHLKLELRLGTRRYRAIAFGRTEPLPRRASIAFTLARNDYGGAARVELVVQGVGYTSGLPESSRAPWKPNA
ncbi:MAG: single-stranded-DNA-specific exonuclease RecJ [Burkholderiaceae bacterium]|nr:single-stranded-DNA-specific exonuclease RecJ [Burkholderiaceae bacterium]